jgi:hypothetical protein
MAKGKVKELKKAISAEQLEKLQSIVSEMTRMQTVIGGLELQKAETTVQYNSVKAILDEFQKELEAEYGNVNISLKDGTITENASNS